MKIKIRKTKAKTDFPTLKYRKKAINTHKKTANDRAFKCYIYVLTTPPELSRNPLKVLLEHVPINFLLSVNFEFCADGLV
jgi:hypothetical protein